MPAGVPGRHVRDRRVRRRERGAVRRGAARRPTTRSLAASLAALPGSAPCRGGVVPSRSHRRGVTPIAAAGRHRHARRRSARPVCAAGGPHDGLPHLGARPRPPTRRRARSPTVHLVAPYDDPESLDVLAARLCRRDHRVREPAGRGARAARRRARSWHRHQRRWPIAQDRIAEKSFLGSIGAPTAPWAPLVDDCDVAVAAGLGGDVIVKTARLGYDGKGQRRARGDAEAIDAAWDALGRRPVRRRGTARARARAERRARPHGRGDRGLRRRRERARARHPRSHRGAGPHRPVARGGRGPARRGDRRTPRLPSACWQSSCSWSMAPWS